MVPLPVGPRLPGVAGTERLALAATAAQRVRPRRRSPRTLPLIVIDICRHVQIHHPDSPPHDVRVFRIVAGPFSQPAPSATRAAFWARRRDLDNRRDKASAESPLARGTIRPLFTRTVLTGSSSARAIRRCRITAVWHRRHRRAGRYPRLRSIVRCAGTRPQTTQSRERRRRGLVTGATACGHGPS